MSAWTFEIRKIYEGSWFRAQLNEIPRYKATIYCDGRRYESEDYYSHRRAIREVRRSIIENMKPYNGKTKSNREIRREEKLEVELGIPQ